MSFEYPCPCCRYYTLGSVGLREQCPCCGWTDAGTYDAECCAFIDEAQRNFREYGACSRMLLDAVTPPSPGLRRAPPPLTIDEWKSALLTRFVPRAREVFAKAKRPKHFTSLHCDECIEHDEEMQPYDNDTLPLSRINHPGWNPVNFLTPQGLRYFIPGLVRCQLHEMQKAVATGGGWRYFDLVDFHLRDAEAERFALFAPDEIQFVADFYEELLRCPGYEGFFYLSHEKVRDAAQSWLARAERTRVRQP